MTSPLSPCGRGVRGEGSAPRGAALARRTPHPSPSVTPSPARGEGSARLCVFFIRPPGFRPAAYSERRRGAHAPTPHPADQRAFARTPVFRRALVGHLLPQGEKGARAFAPSSSRLQAFDRLQIRNEGAALTRRPLIRPTKGRSQERPSFDGLWSATFSRKGRRERAPLRLLHPASRLSTGCKFGTKSRRQGARPRRTPDSPTISATYWLCR
jgi:hypothetical protein